MTILDAVTPSTGSGIWHCTMRGAAEMPQRCIQRDLALKDFLSRQPPGKLPSAAAGSVIRLLEECWTDLEGSDAEAMHAGKLVRAKDLTWHAPFLNFVIERHGGTVLGSTRAELHRWEIDVGRGTAICSVAGRRQVKKMAPRLNLKSMADEVARHIRDGSDHRAVEWSPDRSRVRVLIGTVIPAEGFKQTIESRRRRFKDALRARLPGWREIGGVWERTT